MTLFRVRRSQLLETSILAVAVLMALGVRTSALTVLSPTESSTVREKVRIVIPRTAVPTDGFVAINIDGKFRVAAALPEEVKNPGHSDSPYYTYIWDTKAPVLSPGPSAEPVKLGDGKHEIEVQIHNSLGKKTDFAKLNVLLKNKVSLPTPPPAIKLYYRYRVGDLSVYHIKVDGDVQDNQGQPYLSGIALLKAEFDVIQSVEDVFPDGSALVRYRLGPDSTAQYLGQPISLEQTPGTAFSVYKEISKFGRVLQKDVIRKSSTTVTDVLPMLPGKAVQLGEGWPSTFKIKIEGINNSGPVGFTLTNVLDSIEWESGRECAKIESTMTSTGKLNVLPSGDGSDDQTPAKGTGTFFIAYKTGRLIKAFATIEATAAIDQATLTGLQQGSLTPNTGTPGGASPYGLPPALAGVQKQYQDALDTAMDPDSEIQRQKKAPVYSAPGTEAAPKTTVRVRLNWSLDFKK